MPPLCTVIVPRITEPIAPFGTANVHLPAPPEIRPVAGTLWPRETTRHPTVPDVTGRPVSDRVTPSATVKGLPAIGPLAEAKTRVTTSLSAGLFVSA